MEPDALERTLTEARGFLELGMPAEAWEAVETLPFDDSRMHPDTIAVRLLILAKLKKWELGAHLLRSVTAAHDIQHRAAAGAYLLAHAADMCERGQIDSARESVRRLCAVYPEGKAHVIESPALLSMWP